MARSVVHIGTADTSGGAARGSFRIHNGLRARGWDSKMLVGYRMERNRPDIDGLIERHPLHRYALWRLAQIVEQRTGLEYMLLPGTQRVLDHTFVRDAAIVHLHNLHGGFFRTDLLPKLSRRAPLVWTLADYWPLTGHCYYPGAFDCVKWQTGCGACPGLRDTAHYPLSRDTSTFLWRRKARLYRDSRITFVALTPWFRDQIASGPLAQGKRIEVIPYGQDTSAFRPIDRAHAKAVFDIDPAHKVALFVATRLDLPRKGWAHFQAALLRLKEKYGRELVVLTVGAGEIPAALREAYTCKSLGTVQDDRLLNLAYCAADIFVGPSEFELFGNIFLEAMACGVPVVAFNVTGLDYVVRPMETGYLAKPLDVEDLARGIDLLLGNDELRRSLGRNARLLVEREFSMDRQAERYERLYETLLSERAAA